MSTPAIAVTGLSKTYTVRQKSSGFKSLFTKKHQAVQAVKDVTLNIQPGDVVGFIGPNGAGKSTTIKMMTGILSRTAGDVQIFGKDPQRHRRQLAYRIGTVFGQRSQLWYHLPPSDTFEVLARIYELDRSEYNKRLAMLTEAFELQEFLHVPIRKLSLGQRMRCEIAASLLHSPDVLFLDEPTIGLDVIAKQKIREVITKLNQQDNVTILLTSHDAGDIEQLCERTVVINHGRLIFDDTTKKFKSTFITSKTVELVTTTPHKSPVLPVGNLKDSTDMTMRIELPQTDASGDSLKQLLDWAANKLDLADINIYEPPMEDIIANIYQQQGKGYAS